jgi:hypothetical protein
VQHLVNKSWWGMPLLLVCNPHTLDFSKLWTCVAMHIPNEETKTWPCPWCKFLTVQETWLWQIYIYHGPVYSFFILATITLRLGFLLGIRAPMFTDVISGLKIQRELGMEKMVRKEDLQIFFFWCSSCARFLQPKFQRKSRLFKMARSRLQVPLW